MEKERGITIASKNKMCYDALLVTVGKHTYQLSDDDIQDGDLIYNEFAKKIDQCLKIDTQGMMCVEFDSGARAVFSNKHYKKAVRQ